MKKINCLIKAAAAVVLALSFTACSAEADIESEIQIPIYQLEETFNTVEVQYRDLEANTNVAASIGYALSDALSTAQSGNLVSVNVQKYQYLSEGDVIAVIDSSALNYTYLAQEIITNAAYAAYEAGGTQEDLLNYEYEKAVLDSIQYQIDSYTIIAPYDCIVTDVASLTAGTELEAGTYVCSIAYPDEIYVYVSSDGDTFKLGSKVGVTLTGSTFEGTVVSVPPQSDSSSAQQSSSNWGGNSGGLGSSAYGGPTSADSSKYVIIGFEPDVLQALLEETPNAVIAAWATVTVTTDKMCNVLCVPTSAITSRESTYVYLYQDGQKLQTPVTVGAEINGYSVILSGLKEGDLIIV